MVIFKLNKLLEKENIGQRELSRETGIRQATISDYVNNKALSSPNSINLLICFLKHSQL